jgi:hypothetical protein
MGVSKHAVELLPNDAAKLFQKDAVKLLPVIGHWAQGVRQAQAQS